MQKKIIALAIAGLSGTAMAQSNVTIYGLIDSGLYQYTSKGNDTNKLNSTGSESSSNGSGDRFGTRLGFKGTEALGNGLNAGFLIEYGVNITTAQDTNATSSGSLANSFQNLRQGYVSLAGNWGSVKLGTQYSFIDPASGVVGPSQVDSGSNGNLGAAKLLKYGQDARAGNLIKYESPVFSGFSFGLGYQFSETTANGTATPAQTGGVKQGESSMLALNYLTGPAALGYSYQKINHSTNGINNGALASGGRLTVVDVTGTTNDLYTAVVFPATSNPTTTKTYHIVGGSYDFGAAKVGLNYSTFKLDVDTPAAAATFSGLKSNQTSLSFAIPVSSNFEISGGYTFGKLKSTASDLFKDKGIDLYATYSLSKRTRVYGTYKRSNYDLQNQAALFYTNAAGTAGLAATQSISNDQIGAGIVHSF